MKLELPITQTGMVNIISVLLLLLFIAIAKIVLDMRYISKIKRELNNLRREKAQIVEKCEELKKEIDRLKERERSIEVMEEKLKASEKEIEAERRRLEEELLKVKAMEETLDMHRLKIGELKKEKMELERLN